MAAMSSAAPAPGTATAGDLPDPRPPLPAHKACEALPRVAEAAAPTPIARPLAPLVPRLCAGENLATGDTWIGMVMGLAARGRLDEASK